MEGVTLDMERFRQGDSLIFKTVFDGLYHSLCLFTNRFLNNLDASEDIVQEAFCALWNHREEMESVIHIKSFLYSVTRNTVLNYIKHQKIRLRYEQSFYGIDRNIQFFGNLIIVFALYGKNENSFTFGRKIFLGFKQYPLHFFLYNEIFE